MRKLKKALYSARVRARWWREQGKWQTQIVKSARDVLTEVQDQRDFLLNRCNQLESLYRQEHERAEELDAYNRVLQWRVNQGGQQQHAPNAQLQQYSQLAGAANQQNQQSAQNYPNVQNYHNVIGSQIDSPWHECTCIPGRYALLNPR